MLKSSKIYVAGHKGLVGSAIYSRLLNDGYTNVIVRTSKELDLTMKTIMRKKGFETSNDKIIV
jgi:GDP-L-fucose synthase